jgi:hypothetical protein
MSELETLQECWLLIDGNEMPDEIANQPIELVRKSIHWLRHGVYPVIPKTPVAVPVSADESMAEWDSTDEGRLNAYGG